jgi:hypothetical protein
VRVALILLVLAAGSIAEAKPCVEEATIGTLWICGKPTEAPSHGGETSVLDARYTVENRGRQAVVVELRTLDILDPQDARLRLAIDYANFLPAPVRTTKSTIAPGAKLDVVIFGKGSIAKLRYHVVYRHEVLFRVGATERHVKASEMYFRHPRKRM